MTFAANTDVAVDKSKAEIEKLLSKYGASQFMSGWDSAGKAMVAFCANDRNIKFILEMPRQDDDEFRLTPNKKRERSDADRYRVWEQACRQRWRALKLVIQAKLEAVECGIAEFEDEFLAHIVLPGGKQVKDWLRPQIALAYEHKRMPSLLPGLPAPKVD